MSGESAARPKISGIVIMGDAHTHAERTRETHIVTTKCDRDERVAYTWQRPFIASARYPLCRECVAAIESEIAS